jgi:hypothetical protein
MADQLKYVYGTITKREQLGDGSVLVEGRLAGETLDMDGQVLDYDWLSSVLPKWGERGNIRVMHNRHAVGKMVSLVGDDEKREWYMTAKIVDPVEAKKCLEDVYTGWSGGIKNPIVKGIGNAEHPGGRVVGGSWIESSLVDYPCDENNQLVVHKGASPTNVLQLQAEGVADEGDPEPVAEPPEPVNPSPSPPSPEGLSRAARALIRGLMADDTWDFDILVDTHRNVITYVDAAHAPERLAAAPALKVAVAALETAIETAPDENYKVAAAALQGTFEAFLGKRDFSSDKRKALADKGHALPDGSFPIETKEDVHNAVKLAGKAKDPGKARAHIKKRAAAIGASDAIPDSWKDTVPDVTKGAGVTDEQAVEILSKINALESGATPEAMKAALSEALEPLAKRIADMEERAAAGGPMIGATRKLSAGNTEKQARIDLLTRYLGHPDRAVAAGAREELEKIAQ